MVEQARYEAYGTPIGMPLGDVDMNGRVTSADTTQISAWDSGGTYDVRGDLNLDGDVNTTDYNTSNGNTGTTLGRGVLSDDPDTVRNRNGYAGYIFDDKPGFETYHVRFRWYNASLARWLMRDPAEYTDGLNLYRYVQSSPVTYFDPLGLYTCAVCRPACDVEPSCADDWTQECTELAEFICGDFGPPERDIRHCKYVAKRYPVPVESGVCDSYGDQTFAPWLGIPLPPTLSDCVFERDFCNSSCVEPRCVCECMGNGEWENHIRACLRCMIIRGTPIDEAHTLCLDDDAGFGFTWPQRFDLLSCLEDCCVPFWKCL